MKSIRALLLSAALFALSFHAVRAAEATPPVSNHATTPRILKNPAALDRDTLQDVALLEVSGNPHFSAEEMTRVKEYVDRGGALLVVIDEENRTPLTKDGSASLIAPFGLSFTGDTAYLHNCGAIAKSGVLHRSDLELPYSGGRAVVGGTPFAWRLDQAGNPAEVFAAFVETPTGGRIVALAEGMAYLGMGSNDGARLSGVFRDPSKTTYWGKDSAQFMQDVRAWLLAPRKSKG